MGSINLRVYVLSIGALGLAVAACGTAPPPASSEPTPGRTDERAAPAAASASVAAATPAPPEEELQKSDEVVGTGDEATPGSAVRVHYVGSLDDGTVFDSSRQRGAPFSFILGKGSVIRGWDLGVLGMRVGGRRKLVIPSRLGYGAAGSPPTIPPNARLHFDIELLHVVQ